MNTALFGAKRACSDMSPLWEAHAPSRAAIGALANRVSICTHIHLESQLPERSFRQNAETSTLQARAPQIAPQHRQERVNLANVRK
jgi:hypothetical protein